MKNRADILESFKAATDFYRHKLAQVRSFEDVPLTTKQELTESQVASPPFGTFTDYSKPIYQIYRTSGTTASPLLLSFTRQDVDYITDIGAASFRHSGMGSHGNAEVVLNCLNLSMWAGGFLDSQAMMKTGVQAVNFGTGNTIELIKLVLSFRESFKTSLHCTPSYLPILEGKLRDELGMDPGQMNLHALYLGAEGGVQNNDFRHALMTTWHCPVYNANYGMSEVCSIMASASDDNILKFPGLLLRSYYLELIEDSGTAVDQHSWKEGDTGDLVVTSLAKESQPLLRYHTKERLNILGRDESGIYFEVLGRSDDMLVYKGINFFPEQLRGIILRLKELTGNYSVQVRKRDGLIEDINVLCEIRRDLHVDESRLRRQLESRIRNELTLKVQVNFVYSLDIKGNKLKMVEYV